MTAVRLETRRGGYTRPLPILADADRTLPSVWQLEAPGPNGLVEDVEALCVGVLAETVRRTGTRFGHIDKHDSLGFLLGHVPVLHAKYDPALRNGSGSFSGYLYDRLRYRLIDEWRAQYGRNGEKRHESLDVGGDGALESALRGKQDDDPFAGADACGGLLADADSGDDGLVGDPDREARRRAEGRARIARSLRDRGKVNTPPPFVDCRSCGERSYRQAPNGMPGWHFPDSCSCGAPLLELVAVAAAAGGLEPGRTEAAA